MSLWRIRAVGLLTTFLIVESARALVFAQADVTSAGAALVRRELLNDNLTAQGNVHLYEEPQRFPIIPFLWRQPARVGEVEKGEEVEVVGIKETSVWQRRFVWLQIQRVPDPGDAPMSGWIMLGPQHLAIASVWDQWERSTSQEQ